MNNKKTKNKSRNKLNKSTENMMETLVNNEQIVKLDSINAEQTTLSEITNESVTLIENDQMTSEAPKKPKRSKGKKKKGISIQDVDNIEQSIKTTDKIQELDVDVTEKVNEENDQITPSIRKKKKKTKKQAESLKEELKCLNVDTTKLTEKQSDIFIDTNINIQTTPENTDAVKTESNCKKKRKKKRRSDSEKSDKCDSCISAFQTLIEESSSTSENVLASIEDNNNDGSMGSLLLESNITDKGNIALNKESVPILEKHEIIFNKPQPEKILDILENKNEESCSQEECLNKDKEEHSIPNEDLTVTPKPKAKIAKPVAKRHKSKQDQKFEETISPLNEIIENKSIDNEPSETEESIMNKQNVEANIDNGFLKEATTSASETDVNIYKISREPQANKQEPNFTHKNKKKQNKKDLSINQEDKEQSKELQCTIDKKGFHDISTQHNEGCNVKSENISKDTLNIPDLIEYPRSNSEQYTDNNNNTVIQEITIQDVKLAIPINIPEPVIQGSGESPEKCEEVERVSINVTEMISQPSPGTDQKNILLPLTVQNEKIDVRSKMIEVNRDMEELRLSIERSLAELTAIEKTDSEVDKEFEELFQCHNIVPPPSKINSSDDSNAFHASEENCTDINVENTKKSCNISEDVKPKTTSETRRSGQEKTHSNKNITESQPLANLIEINENQGFTTRTDKIGPVCPSRRDKGKKKSKKKDKKEAISNSENTNSIHDENAVKESNQQESDKSESTKEKGKQHTANDNENNKISQKLDTTFEPIENFEDALTSSIDDVNKTFDIIAEDAIRSMDSIQSCNFPQINIISPAEVAEEKVDEKRDKTQTSNPISHPKNLLGHPNIPASSNKCDYKKEKSKPPNSIQAKVKIKDSADIEKMPKDKKCLLDEKTKSVKECDDFEKSYFVNKDDNLVYKYSYRKVFLQSTCHVCKKEILHRVSCKFCSLLFYCCLKHRDEDWPRHQSLCFAVSTIAHLKGQRYIFASTQNIVGQNYRMLRMQMILSCEKILNRKLLPWEQEALLYPRICADVNCRQWKQEQLKDCDGCGQISYCSDREDHLPPTHKRWCGSYALYQKLVSYHLTKGRLEPRLPTKVFSQFKMPDKINDILGSMYEEKIDMDDMQYAVLTQIATAPLTVAYCHQLYSNKMNSTYANGSKKKSIFTIHVVGADLTFEVDVLNKWEIFFLHLRSDIQDLRVVVVGDGNSSKLPLNMIRDVKLCENCRINKRRLLIDLHDSDSYVHYYSSNDFVTPDIVCAFNPNIQRSSLYNIDKWPSTVNSILKQRVPFILTAYTVEELRRDLAKIRECSKVDFNVVVEIKLNPFYSVKPDRNFITDDEMPLLFKNYAFCLLCGSL